MSLGRMRIAYCLPWLLLGCASVDPSLCTVERDVLGVLCDERPRLDLQTAVDIARSSPELEDALLARAAPRMLSPDGEAEAWELSFWAGSGLLSTTVRPNSEPGEWWAEPELPSCPIEDGLLPMSSTTVTHAAIGEWERVYDRILEIEPTDLHLVQSSQCFPYAELPAQRLRHVRIRTADGLWIARFEEADQLTGLEGPCPLDATLTECIARLLQ